MKTIRMPKELLAKWLAALRSSEINGKPIQQAKYKLHNKRGGYCCLGVLQVCAAGRTQRDMQSDSDLPSKYWLEKFGVDFLSEQGDSDTAPWLPTLGEAASWANDCGRTFAEIADAIEACAEGV